MFNTSFPFYSVFITLSLASGLLVLAFNLRSFRLSIDEKVSFFALLLFSTIIGGKLFTLLSHLGSAGSHSTNFSSLGLSSYGGVFGLIFSAFIFSKILKKSPVSFPAFLSALLPSTLLMYSVGKLGCFFAGCCFGIVYSGPLAVTYLYSSSAPVGVSLFPVQILETTLFFFLFLVFEFLYLRHFSRSASSQKMYSYSAWLLFFAALLKFLLDFLRTGHSYLTLSGILSLNQIVSLMLITVAIIYLFFFSKRTQK